MKKSDWKLWLKDKIECKFWLDIYIKKKILKKVMRRIIIILIVLIVSGFLWLAFFSRDAQERQIKAEIAQADYCEVASDCVMVASSKCPFGCHIHANKNEAERIDDLLNGYESRCAYQCIPFKGVECVNNTCHVAR